MKTKNIMLGFVMLIMLLTTMVSVYAVANPTLYYAMDDGSVSATAVNDTYLKYNATFAVTTYINYSTSSNKNGAGHIALASANNAANGRITSAFKLSLNTSFTLNYWEKISATTEKHDWVIHASDTNYLMGGINAYGCGAYYCVRSVGLASAVTLSSASNTASNSWNMITLTYSHDTKVMKIYINGTYKANASNMYFTSGTPTLYLGSVWGTNTMNGHMDEFGLWNNTELTSSEVSDLWNSGTGLFFSAPAADTTPPTISAPANASIVYGNWDGVKFNFTDTSGIGTVSINDSLFSLSTAGVLNKTATLGVANYLVAMQVNDTLNNSANYTYALNISQATGSAISYINNSRANLSTTYTNITTNCTTQGQANTSTSDTSVYAIGSYNITCTLANSQNYTSASETWLLTIQTPPDTTPPVLYAPDYGIIIPFNDAVNVTFTATDNIAVSNSTWRTNSSLFTITNGTMTNASKLGVANYYINVSVNDTSNNMQSGTYNVNVTKLASSSTLLIEGMNSSVLTVVNPNGYTDYITANCTTIGDTQTSTQNSTNYTVGTHTLVCSYASSQNYSTSSQTWYIYVGAYNDTTAPTFSVRPENDTLYYNTTWAGVGFTCTDDIGVTGYGVNDTNFEMNSTGWLNKTGTEEFGIINLNISCYDGSGNYAYQEYSVYDPAYPYIINTTYTTYNSATWIGVQLSGNVPLYNWTRDNAVFSITDSGYITYNGNVTSGNVTSVVTARDEFNESVSGLFTLVIRENVGLQIWSCPTSDNYWLIYLMIGLALAFLIIAEVMRLRIAGCAAGFTLTFAWLFFGACQPLLTIFIPVVGIWLVVYYITAN